MEADSSGESQIVSQTPSTRPPTPTPAPKPPSPPGIRTPAKLKAELSSFPPEYLCFLNEQTVVRFAYPSPFIDWAGFAFIDHVPSVSSVTLRRPYEFVREDGSIEKEEGEMLHRQELVVRRHFESEEGETSLEAILEDESVMSRILAGPEECQSIISEEVAQDAVRLVVLGGPAEAEPGFGGLFLDSDDNSIAYVYMLDPSQQQEAEAAAEKVLGQRDFSRIREVRVLQGQYSMSQLTRWYELMRDPIYSVEGIQYTDLNEAKNRIQVRTSPRPGAHEEMQDIVMSVGVPLEAVIIEVGCSDVGDLYQSPPVPDDPMYRTIDFLVEAPDELRWDRVQASLADYVVVETETIEFSSDLVLEQIDPLVPTNKGEPMVMTGHPELTSGDYLRGLSVDGFIFYWRGNTGKITTIIVLSVDKNPDPNLLCVFNACLHLVITPSN